MKSSKVIFYTLLISIVIVGVDALTREYSRIIPVEVTEKLTVHPKYEAFGEPVPPLLYLKLEANSSRNRFVYLHPVSEDEFNRIEQGDWVPMYQEQGKYLGVLYRTVVILED